MIWILSVPSNHKLDMHRSNVSSNGSGICDQGLAGPKGTSKYMNEWSKYLGLLLLSQWFLWTIKHLWPRGVCLMVGWAEEENMGIIYIWFCILFRHHFNSCNITVLLGDILERQSWREIFTLDKTSGNIPFKKNVKMWLYTDLWIVANGLADGQELGRSVIRKLLRKDI